MGEYSQEEFIKGCQTLGCDSKESWKSVLTSRLYPELKDASKFESLYKYTFGYATEKGFKNVEVETACALWELLLKDQCGFLDKWISFFKDEKKELKVVTKDTWDLFFDFIS